MGQARKSHDTLIDRRTGREWPLNCMTVISTWWRLSMRFLRSSGRSSRRRTIISLSQVEFEFQLEWRCGKECHTRPKGLGVLMNWGPEKMLIRCSKESQHPAEWTPGPPVEHQENEKDTTLTAIRVGVKIFQFCSVPSSLSHANLWVTLFEPWQEIER